MKPKFIFLLLLLTSLFTQNAYATKVVTPTSTTQKTTEKHTETTTQSAKQTKSTKVTSAMPFSTDGNLTLDDELSTEDDKEFYTVHTRSGAQFYIIIDKAAKTDNVYFLNEVDEADLMSLLSESGISLESEKEETSAEEQSTYQEEMPVQQSSGGEGSTLPIFIIAIAAGVIIVYKVKKKNRKQIEDDDDDEEADTEEGEEENEQFSSDNAMETQKSVYGDDEDASGISFENRQQPQFESFSEENDDRSYSEDVPDVSADDIDLLDD